MPPRARFLVVGLAACLLVAAPLALALHEHEAEEHCDPCRMGGPSLGALRFDPVLVTAPQPEECVLEAHPAPRSEARSTTCGPRAPPA